MADYRQIHTLIWDDDWFCQLSSDEKIVFIWFFSNRRASVSGLYKFTEFICSRETGISIENISHIIKKLSDDKRITVEDGWVWVKNLRKYNDSNSPNSRKRIETDLSMLPDNELKDLYQAHYKPLDSPLIAPSNTLLEQRTENNEKGTENREQPNDDRQKTPGEIYDDMFQSNQLSVAFEKAAGILAHTPQKWTRSLEELDRQGVSADDILTAVQELREKEYSIVGIWSVQNAAISCMAKRKNGTAKTKRPGKELEILP